MFMFRYFSLKLGDINLDKIGIILFRKELLLVENFI